MGWVGVMLGGVASVLLYRADSPMLLALAVIISAVNFWSYGVMHNQAVAGAAQRADYRGGFWDFSEADLPAVSTSITLLNLATTIAIVALFITAIVVTI